MRRKLWEVTDKEGARQGWGFFCPGCRYGHWFDEKRWTFDGNVDSPTFTPSLLVHGRAPHPRCHLYLTAGKLHFLADCEHALAGQTVELPELD